jgi:hypothetical protein
MASEGQNKMPQPCGTVVLSIDLELDLGYTGSSLTRQLDAARSQLLDLAGKWNVPATWAVADPMLSASTEPILRAGGGHEVAVLGDRAWLGTGCGHDRLARELVRRFTVPGKAGISVHTLVSRNVDPVPHLDLLVEHGVTGIAAPAADAPAKDHRSSPLRYGLWQPPQAWRLAPDAPWWSPTAWQVRRQVQRASRQGGVLHLRIDALALVDAPTTAPLVHWLLAYLGRARDAGRIEIATIGALAAAALAQRAGRPSRSALRPAA